MIVLFDKWRPDLTPMNSGAVNAINVIMVDDGYEVMPSPTKIRPSGYAGGTPLRLIVGRSANTVVMPIVMGSTLSYRATNNVWSPLANSAISSESWSTVPWGDKIYAVNGVDPLIRIDVDVDGNFVPITMPNGLSGKYLAQVKNFLMMADCREFRNSSRFPYRLQWSGLQRPEQWERNAAIQSDMQDVTAIGQFRGLTGGEFALLLGSTGFARGDYVGPDIIFEFNVIEEDVGCDIPNSVIRTGNTTYWWSRRGWRSSNGGASATIGLGHVDKWFERTHDKTKINRMSVQLIPGRPIILWSFVSRYSVDGEPDYCLAYNWESNAWSYGTVRVQILGISVTPSVFTDDNNIPLPGFIYGISTTDEYNQLTDGWGEDVDFPAAMLDGTLCKMEQSGNLVSEIETKEKQLNPDGLAISNKFLPIVQNATTIRGKVSGRDTASDTAPKIRDGLIPEPSGIISARVKSRYHTFKLYLEGPFTKAVGVDLIDVRPGGSR